MTIIRFFENSVRANYEPSSLHSFEKLDRIHHHNVLLLLLSSSLSHYYYYYYYYYYYIVIITNI
jgi:hypothetical protein